MFDLLSGDNRNSHYHVDEPNLTRL